MVNYWNKRKILFGERAFLPLQELIQQERGDNSTKEDGEPFPVGNHVLLPNDAFGRSVLFFAEGRPKDPAASLRRSFLLFHSLVLGKSNENVQKHGCVLVVDGRGIDPERFNRKHYRKKLQLLYEVPIYIRSIHVCFAAFKSAARLLQPSILWMYGRNLRLRRKVHYGTSTVLALSLQECGLQPEGLPPCLGGTFQGYKSTAQVPDDERHTEPK